jgi:hypothetical protein
MYGEIERIGDVAGTAVACSWVELQADKTCAGSGWRSSFQFALVKYGQQNAA